ncbi:hypothetical protein [Beggiatoa leptomitoformis]|uniref:Argininosuccinate lyase n=1 Tax=Beggiatoa leptomitoformis TaxID=288004 RepID=A0A2N9YA98_9GAMM|nr:hypothetical protein [Beggiatoa leptomitoformis]ALG67197.1 hypothetical protein AL038_05075 [Beggiatoa leptomitoformis]AUI67396.1 hypothetical protein BLE401_00915 [Beggiatoa leptomitoformis]
MNIKKLAALVCLLPLALSAQLAFAVQYTITNDSGVVIDELYLAASETKDWGHDILGQDTLDNGATVEILFDHDDDRCMWDLAIKDTAGNQIMWYNFDLCKYSKLTLKPDGVASYE